MNCHMQKVLDFIKDNPTCSYKEIASATGEQVTMVSSCIRILVEQKRIVRHNHKNKTGGAAKNSYEVI